MIEPIFLADTTTLCDLHSTTYSGTSLPSAFVVGPLGFTEREVPMQYIKSAEV